jgi:hypothetical protein
MKKRLSVQRIALTAIAFAALSSGSLALAANQQSGQEQSVLDVLLGQRMAECKAHFDIEPFVAIAVGGDLSGNPKYDQMSQSQSAALANQVETYFRTGRIPLTPQQKLSPQAVGCAIFAEGAMAGGTGRSIVSAIAQAIGEAIGSAFKKVFGGPQ